MVTMESGQRTLGFQPDSGVCTFCQQDGYSKDHLFALLCAGFQPAEASFTRLVCYIKPAVLRLVQQHLLQSVVLPWFRLLTSSQLRLQSPDARIHSVAMRSVFRKRVWGSRSGLQFRIPAVSTVGSSEEVVLHRTGTCKEEGV